MKEPTDFDFFCNAIYDNNKTEHQPVSSGIRCGHCGYGLTTYNCGGWLYLVECRYCRIKSLVMAKDQKTACYKDICTQAAPS